MAPSIQQGAENGDFRHSRAFPLKFLLISIAVHLCLLLAVQKTVPWPSTPLKPEIFHVRLLREPMDPADESAGPPPVESGSVKPLREDTIRLGDELGLHSDYADDIKQRLAAAWVYPEKALVEAIEGTVRIRFTLESDGKLTGSDLLSSSGHACLDENVTRAVTQAAPFPPFPKDLNVERLHIEAGFTYLLAAPPRIRD